MTLKTLLPSALRVVLLTLAWLLLGMSLSRAESLQDGPYVIRAADGGWTSRWVEGEGESARVRDKAVKVGEAVTVSNVGAFPSFDVKLRGPAKPATDEINVGPRARLFVMADTHGEFEIAAQLLQRQGVIDERLRWAFGKGHLAVLGDVFDRGPNHTELLWLLYKLEAEAARAGGGVHLALGNHETMVLNGDLRYLNPKYPRVAELLGVERYPSLWNEQTLLGQWLRTKAAVFRLGDYLCLHGGVSRELVDRGLPLSEINQRVRAALTEQATAPVEPTQFLMGPYGPLWYRGYFETAARQAGMQAAAPADIELIRQRFGVQTILVGHTSVPAITSLYEGRVIAVQVYPHRDQQTHAPVMEGLLIDKGQLFRARVDGSTELLPRS
ncbi:metallophosphoesterase [Steroidobacter sp.]|uniref:metallophosphoesterase n=1 Tax=Steroidobacter sp. TaxID=1978227 RepID=UPI001A63FECA|nr:metallophosphoesterase [Steroidobacter sp.]MBL8266163.1 metallophosphoesterase [Steroidobacter sp.]